jgi:ornithine carbamoyltransferase
VTRHLLEIDDLHRYEIEDVLDLASKSSLPKSYEGLGVALFFEKPSLRTRHSCEMATVQLGGHPLSFYGDEVGPASREPVADIGRVLSGYHAVLGARVYEHATLEQLASTATIPVVNLLSDREHPCQALADLLTMRQVFGDVEGRSLAWIGDFNNVARSLAIGAAMLGMKVRIASPPDFGPTDADLDRIAQHGPEAVVTARAHEAAAGAWAVHTDVWTSMGQEAEIEARRRAFEGFRVDDSVMRAAADGAVFMHCLPAHRGEEAAASVVDGPQSVIFAQAQNRMHSFRGLLAWLASKEGFG